MKKIFRGLTLGLACLSAVGLTACFEYEEAVINLDVDLNQKIELNTLYPNSGMANTEFQSSRTTRYFEELTGYKVTYEQALDNQTTIVGNILLDQQPYHMLKLESGTYMAMVGDQNFVDLKPALEKYGQNILKTVPKEAWDAVTQDGKIYAIPEIGFGQMLGSALVWNMRQLNEVGITKVPETFTEVTDAFYALKNHFRTELGNEQYYAFAMQSACAYIEPLAAAFDLNKDFYENSKGEVEHVMFHDKYDDYLSYLNSLVRNQIISVEWQGYSGTNVYSEMAKGNLGCGYLPYWYINNLVASMATSSEYASEEEARNSLGWSLTIKGDGSYGTSVQSVGKTLYYQSIGYYITIPAHMAEYGAYVIDWIDQRITDSAFEGYRLGDLGVHYEYTTSSDKDAINVNIAGQDKYIKLLPAYNTDILPTSMYQTAVNPKVAKELWILSEQSYKCWKILLDETDYDNIVGNAIAMAPYIQGWSEIDISSRSKVITYEQKIINDRNDTLFNEDLAALRKLWSSNYWTAEVSANVQSWYKNK